MKVINADKTVEDLPAEYNTPMMQQFLGLKEQYPDCILFFRLGDFYEMFLDDAKLGAEVLDITLTSRSRGKDGRIPMAGIPYHAVDSYLAKMVKSGHKVAIVEQLTAPAAGTLVERDVVRIVTPGTVLDEKSLDRKQNNYIVSLNITDEVLAISAADLSTGDFQTSEILLKDFEKLEHAISNEFSRFSPIEAVLPKNLYEDSSILKVLNSFDGLNIYPFSDWEYHANNAKNKLHNHFKVKKLDGFGLQDKMQSQAVSAALLGYLKYTQKDQVAHFKKITYYDSSDHVVLDRSTITNLELFSTIRDRSKRGTLFNVLDETSTSMGARMLKRFILKPLYNKKEIESRLDAVAEFLDHRMKRVEIKNLLIEISDIERILARLSTGLGNARDLITLKSSLIKMLEIKKILEEFDSELVRKISKDFGDKLVGVINLVDSRILEEPAFDTRDGGIIKDGVDSALDTLRKKSGKSKSFILELEKTERTRTGISSLKVKFNKVFGYYIEISKSNLDAVPKDYIRKQTLVNAERFITPELKTHEDIILEASEEINAIELQIFENTVVVLLEGVEYLQNASVSLAILDVLVCFSQLAESNRYVRPSFGVSGEILIKEGRHPVVEKLLDSGEFVPNDVNLNCSDQNLLLITGPNMSGKSVYLRQVALIILMAQMGCYVPADSVEISLVDKIFVRSGASDVISSGLSTFMVEMVETAYILNNATENSLIVMDEIGRGTSTYDGISIAWAVAEYLVNNTRAKSLFATHYHELQVLEDKFEGIKNYQVAVDGSESENVEDLVFLHKVISGGADHSHGVAVASLAGVPSEVTKKAMKILKHLELRSGENGKNIDKVSREPDFSPGVLKKLSSLKNTAINELTPLDAMNLLAELIDDL